MFPADFEAVVTCPGSLLCGSVADGVREIEDLIAALQCPAVYFQFKKLKIGQFRRSGSRPKRACKPLFLSEHNHMNYCANCGEKRDENGRTICVHCGGTLVEWEYLFLNYVALGIQIRRPNGEEKMVRKGLTKLQTDYCQVLNELGAGGWEAVLSQDFPVKSILLKRPKPTKSLKASKSLGDSP
jgi:hypothetical protein